MLADALDELLDHHCGGVCSEDEAKRGYRPHSEVMAQCGAAMKAYQEATDPILDFDLHGYHYWRECHNCGHAEGGYLHCMHDGYQNPCHACGTLMPTIKGDCKCRFTLSHEEIIGIAQEKEGGR